MRQELWQIRLSQAAELDIAAIVMWTSDRFGERQARRYAETITRTITGLSMGPNLLNSRVRDDLPAGLRIHPIARRRERARHVLIYRATGSGVVEIVRVLHEAMDFRRHVEP